MIDKFKGKRNTNGFDKNPDNINRKGQPLKGIGLVNSQLKEQGYEPATKQQIESLYMSLLNVDEDILKEMAQDKKQPMLIRIIIKNMLGGKGFDIVEKMLDRGIGKAIQREEREVVTVDVSESLSEEQKEKIAKRYK